MTRDAFWLNHCKEGIGSLLSHVYCCLQGIWGAQVKEEVEDMLDDLQLTDKKSTLSSQLSGGMKRKLRLICLLTASTGTKFPI